MSIKVIYCDCSPDLWVDVAGKLADDYGWDPCYWIGVDKVNIKVKERFPNAVFHDTFQANRGVLPQEAAGNRFAVLDQELLEELSFHESVTLSMMDRMDSGDSFSYQERVDLYHHQLRYWMAVLDQMNPDIVVFPTHPHVVFDYILYILCTRKGIKTAFFAGIVFKHLLLPMKQFEKDSPILPVYRNLLSATNPLKARLSTDTEDILKTLSGDYNQDKMVYMPDCKYELEVPNKAVALIRQALQIYRLPRYSYGLLRSVFTPVRPNWLKKKGKRVEYSHWTAFEYRRHKRKTGKIKRRLLAYYNHLTEKVDLNVPFIYVALAYQPEGSTSPLGGHFVNQTLMVNLLSKSVTEGWWVYVKEHPIQYSDRFYGERSRSFDFYDKLAALPNVKLVPFTISPYALIDNARAVAAITSTTGWEAVVRGTPTLIFGHAWYKGCEGVFYTPTYQKCRDALLKISGGYRVDKKKVRLFAQACEQVCFKGYVENKYKRTSGISHKDNVKNIAQALRGLYENGTSNPTSQKN